MNATKTKTTLKDLINQFIDRPHLSPKTRGYYQDILWKFEWFARHQGWPTDPRLITRGHLREFLTYVSTEEYRWPESPRSWYKKASPATVHHYGVAVKSLFNWAEDEEYIEKSPGARMKLSPPRYKEVEPYSEEEVQAFLQVCRDDARFRYRYLGIRNIAIISLLVDTGLRVSELADIELAHLDPKLRQVRVMGKGSKFRVVPINGEARKALKHYLDIRPQNGEMLWRTSDDHDLTARGIQMVIIHLKRRAGVTSSGCVHRFRHYFATHCLENGMDINTLRLLLGHTTLSMVLKYTRYVEVQRALDQYHHFSPLDSLKNGRNHNRGDNWGFRY